MRDPSPWYAELSLPSLLRAARSAYSHVLRHALDDAGFGDLPRNGPFVLSGIARTGAPLADVIAHLGVSKQAAGQLVDTLVTRGYLERSVDPDDRRRLTVTLTARGQSAATVVRAAVDGLEAELVARVGSDAVGQTRVALGSLVECSEAHHSDASSEPGASSEAGGAAEPGGAPVRPPAPAPAGRAAHGPAAARLAEAARATFERTAVDALGPHLEDSYGIGVGLVTPLDVGVFRVDTTGGDTWVARLFPATREPDAAAADAAVLAHLETCGFPAERPAVPEPVSELDGQRVLVTGFVEDVPRRERREAVRAAGGLTSLGSLLGHLHTLPEPAGPPWHPGGAWHHLADGGPDAELAAADRLLADAGELVTPGSEAQYHALVAALAGLDDAGGLPEALIHPDFVLPNVVAPPTGGLTLVDWTGAGRGPRLWSLAWLLYVEGSKDLRRIDLLAAGYLRHVRPEPEELERLAAVLPARAVVLEVWSYCMGRSSLEAAATRVSVILDSADGISAHAVAALR